MNKLIVVCMLIASFIAGCEPGAVSVRKARKDTSGQSDSDVTSDEGDDDDDGKKSKVTPAKTEVENTPAKTDTETTTPAPPAVADVFAGTQAFKGDAPLQDSTEHHQGSSNAGKECMSCHGAGKGAPTFALGGTIRATKNNPGGATNVEVRVVDDKGKELAFVTTDSVGNFWFPGAVAIPGGARVAIRTSNGGQKMSGAIATGACNSAGCHTSSLPIFLAN